MNGDEDDPAGVAQADVNGDGRPDVVIGQHYNSTVDAGARVPVRLYLNEPAGSGGVRLRDVTDQAGLPAFPTKSPHVEIADVDADGRPDIVTTASGVDGSPIVLRNVGPWAADRGARDSRRRLSPDRRSTGSPGPQSTQTGTVGSTSWWSSGSRACRAGSSAAWARPVTGSR